MTISNDGRSFRTESRALQLFRNGPPYGTIPPPLAQRRPSVRTPLYNGSSGTFLPVKEGLVSMATVKFDNATRTYPGNDKPSVDQLNIDIKDGEFLVLVGPSGCGKSTALRDAGRSRKKSTPATSGSAIET